MIWNITVSIHSFYPQSTMQILRNNWILKTLEGSRAKRINSDKARPIRCHIATIW